eukprot:gene10783-12563_t
MVDIHCNVKRDVDKVPDVGRIEKVRSQQQEREIKVDKSDPRYYKEIAPGIAINPSLGQLDARKIVVTSSKELLDRAKDLCERLGGLDYLPFTQVEVMPETLLPYSLVVMVQPRGIALFDVTPMRNSRIQRKLTSEVSLDFTSGELMFKIQNRTYNRAPLVRAAKLPSLGAPASVLDVTGGLAKDAWILASFGSKVTVIERNPLLHLMIEEALAKAKEHGVCCDIANRIQLVSGDSAQYLVDHINDDPSKQPDIIYMDPMYQSKDKDEANNNSKLEKSALSKKDIRAIRKLVGGDRDSKLLFALSKRIAQHRIIWKKPKVITPHPGVDLSYRAKDTLFPPTSAIISKTIAIKPNQRVIEIIQYASQLAGLQPGYTSHDGQSGSNHPVFLTPEPRPTKGRSFSFSLSGKKKTPAPMTTSTSTSVPGSPAESPVLRSAQLEEELKRCRVSLDYETRSKVELEKKYRKLKKKYTVAKKGPRSRSFSTPSSPERDRRDTIAGGMTPGGNNVEMMSFVHTPKPHNLPMGTWTPATSPFTIGRRSSMRDRDSLRDRDSQDMNTDVTGASSTETAETMSVMEDDADATEIRELKEQLQRIKERMTTEMSKKDETERDKRVLEKELFAQRRMVERRTREFQFVSVRHDDQIEAMGEIAGRLKESLILLRSRLIEEAQMEEDRSHQSQHQQQQEEEEEGELEEESDDIEEEEEYRSSPSRNNSFSQPTLVHHQQSPLTSDISMDQLEMGYVE